MPYGCAHQGHFRFRFHFLVFTRYMPIRTVRTCSSEHVARKFAKLFGESVYIHVMSVIIKDSLCLLTRASDRNYYSARNRAQS